MAEHGSTDSTIRGQPVTIYSLVDHRGITRYVGKTRRTTERRVDEHIWEAKGGHDCYRCRWIRKQIRLGLSFTTHVLEIVPESVWQTRERHWIKLFRFAGKQLTNRTDGGDGVIGRKCKPLSEAHKEKIRQSNLGNKRSPETRRRNALARIGKRTSEETKQKMSLANKGRKFPESHSLLLQKLSPFSRPVYQLSLDGKIIQRFGSMNIAAKAVTNGYDQNIKIACLNQRRTAGGFRWRFCSDD